MYITTSEKVRDLIRQMGLTQKAFAVAIGINPVTLSNCLTKDNFTLKTLEKISRRTGVKVASLLPSRKRTCSTPDNGLAAANSTDKVVKTLFATYKKMLEEANSMNITHCGEGRERKFSEKAMENMLLAAIEAINEAEGANLTLKRGRDDYFRNCINDEYGSHYDGEIQVDFNLYSGDALIAVIEVKSNLDKCYLKRAESDFRDIASSIYMNGGNPSDIRYILFVGQNASMDESIEYHEARFSRDTKSEFGLNEGLRFDKFFIINGKRSSTKKVIDNNPGLSESEIKKFKECVVSAALSTR